MFSYLYFTILLFLLLGIYGIYNDETIYGCLFLALSFSSFAVHTKNTVTTNITDKIIILCIVVYGFQRFYGKLHYWNDNEYNILKIMIIVYTFLFVVWVYLIGWFYGDGVFHPITTISHKYHLCMHLMGILGHFYIINL